MEKKNSHSIEKKESNIYYDNSSEQLHNLFCDNGEGEKKSPAINGDIEISIPKEFYCEKCDYFTRKQSDFLKHLNTKKHNVFSCKNENLKTKCSFCNRQYSSQSNLWKHKQKCKFNKVDIIYENKIEEKVPTSSLTNEMVLELIKQNKELQSALVEQSTAIMEQNNKLVEMSSKGSTHITNNNTTNNTQFNINFFLNEQCKNAVNIIDFVNSLQVQIQDLEKTGKLGYVEGISSIFLKGLRELDVYERPIHCTDLKRETVYVKDKDSWEKDNTDKIKLKTAIKQIARKNLKTLPKWQQENPDFVTLDTKENNEYLKIALNSLGGQTEEEEEKFTEKIIRNVLKDVLIDKKQ
jgi:hypothetical protein